MNKDIDFLFFSGFCFYYFPDKDFLQSPFGLHLYLAQQSLTDLSDVSQQHLFLLALTMNFIITASGDAAVWLQCKNIVLSLVFRC